MIPVLGCQVAAADPLLANGDDMLVALTLLLGCQLAGELLTRGTGLPVPGPVAGLVLMLVLFTVRPSLASALRPTTSVILANLSLLFVPAGVGVIANLDVLAGDGAAILAVLALSTVLSMLATVGTFLLVRNIVGGSGEMTELPALWSYLAASPLTWLTATLVAYLVAVAISGSLGHAPLANPVLLSMTCIVLLLVATGTDYATYFEGAQFIHFLLGPATVALSVPLFDNGRTIRRTVAPILLALAAGSTVAVVSTILLARAFGLSDAVVLSLAPKSTTAPVALGISEAVGGIPSLTAVLVILTGIMGAILVTPMMNVLRVRDWRARGFAVGVAAHGIGTARAFQVNETAGTYAGMGMALNAMLTSLIVPLAAAWLL